MSKSNNIRDVKNDVQILETLLFISGKAGLTKQQIIKSFNNKIGKIYVTSLLKILKSDIEKRNKYLTVISVAGIIRLSSNEMIYDNIKHLIRNKKSSEIKLSNSAIEVLAIVFYKKNVTISTVDKIRNKSSYQIISKLLSMNLLSRTKVTIKTGQKVWSYKITNKLLNRFSLETINKLKSIKKLKEMKGSGDNNRKSLLNIIDDSELS